MVLLVNKELLTSAPNDLTDFYAKYPHLLQDRKLLGLVKPWWLNNHFPLANIRWKYTDTHRFPCFVLDYCWSMVLFQPILSPFFSIGGKKNGFQNSYQSWHRRSAVCKAKTVGGNTSRWSSWQWSGGSWSKIKRFSQCPRNPGLKSKEGYFDNFLGKQRVFWSDIASP